MNIRFVVRPGAQISELADEAHDIILKSPILRHRIIVYFIAGLCDITKKNHGSSLPRNHLQRFIFRSTHPHHAIIHLSIQHNSSHMLHHNHTHTPANLEHTPSKHTPHQLSLTPPTLQRHAIEPHQSHSRNQPTHYRNKYHRQHPNTKTSTTHSLQTWTTYHNTQMQIPPAARWRTPKQ